MADLHNPNSKRIDGLADILFNVSGIRYAIDLSSQAKAEALDRSVNSRINSECVSGLEAFVTKSEGFTTDQLRTHLAAHKYCDVRCRCGCRDA